MQMGFLRFWQNCYPPTIPFLSLRLSSPYTPSAPDGHRARLTAPQQLRTLREGLAHPSDPVVMVKGYTTS